MAVTTSDPAGNDEMIKALKDIFGQQAAATASGGKVFMGKIMGKPTARDEKYGLMPKEKVRWLSEDEAMREFYNWTPKKRSDFLAQLVVAGLVPAGSGALEAEDSWKKLVQASGRYGSAGQQVSPFDLLSGYVKAAGGAQKEAWRNLGAFEVNTVTGEKRWAGPGVYLGDGRAVQVDSRTDLTDPDTARSIATSLFQSLMGRDPQAGELAAFASALNAAEASSPVTQTTTTQYDMNTGQALSTQTQSSGGLTAQSRQAIGEAQIKKNKEYGVNQAVTTYQGAMENLIFGGQG